ncbi:MAG: tetratricopeptide repeat protein [Alphaproteobacteria bacterium]|nr:tetratricopeptide repeat protein [Alphaproteobacteria bacterium]
MRTLFAVFAGVVGLAIALPGAGAAPSGTKEPVAVEADLTGTPLQVGETVFGKFLALRHAESVRDFAAAATFTAQVLAENPDLKDIAQRGHLSMASAGRIAEAAVLAERVVAENEHDPLANMTLAVRAFEREDYPEALDRLNQIELTGIQAIIVPLMRAWALAGDGRTEAALTLLDDLTATKKGLGPITGLHAGMIANLTGRPEAADAAYKRGVAASGDSVALQLVEAYAGLLARTNQHERAIRLVEAFTLANPRTLLIEPTREALAKGQVPDPVVRTFADGAAEALHAVANLLHTERLRAQALIMIQSALHLRPESPATLFLLGQVFEREEQIGMAMEAYRAIDPSTPYGWYARLNLADGHRTQGDIDKALRLLRIMIRERADRSDAARALGDFLRIEERYREAVSAYDTAHERSADDADWRLYYTRGIALERAKKWERAERDLLKALELEPDQPLVLNYLGYSWIEQGQNLERAKAMIEKAVTQRPQDGFIADSLGWALYRLGDYPGAVTHLERAVALEPGDPIINDHLGDAYWLADRREEARFQWKRALSQEPEPEVEEIIRDKLQGKQLPQPLPAKQRRDI